MSPALASCGGSGAAALLSGVERYNRDWVLFITIKYFRLDQQLLNFKLADRGFSAEPLLAVTLILICARIAFFDHFIVGRMRATTYGDSEELVVEAVETPVE